MLRNTILVSALLLGGAAAVPTRRDTIVNTTTCNGQTYIYENLAGFGFTPSDSRDKFGDTAGGIGSSAAIDPTTWTKNGNTYTGILWALPDRGWNTEGTLNYQPRVHKFNITFTPLTNASSNNPPNLQLQYLDSVRFTDPSGFPLTGLDADADPPYLTFSGLTSDVPSATFTGDGFTGNGTGTHHQVVGDTEGLVLMPDGSFWVSDEYGPYIYHFSPTGQMLTSIRPPSAIIPMRNGSESFSADSPPRYAPNDVPTPADPTTGRSNNQGLEGLTASPDGTTLYALMQSALNQEGGQHSSDRRYARLLQYDITSPSTPTMTAEYIVPLPLYTSSSDNSTKVAAQSEIHYISSTQFLVLARDSGAGRGQKKTESLYRHVDVFDISNATNVMGDVYDCANCSIASSRGVLKGGLSTAKYCAWLDFNVNEQLGVFGLHNGGSQDGGLINEKWESLALVPVNPEQSQGWKSWTGGGDEGDDEYFLFSLSDNDFITQNGYLEGGQFQYADESGCNLENQVLVFKVKLPAGSTPRVG